MAARPSRPASYAALFILVIILLAFLYTLIGMTNRFQMSPLDLLFSNPTGGSTLGAALVFFTIPALLQAAVAFALDRRAAWLRIVGAIVAFAITAFCLVWLGLAVVMGARWVVGGMPTTGTMPAGGDFQDLTGIAIFVPVAIIVGYLNGRAALLTVRSL